MRSTGSGAPSHSSRPPISSRHSRGSRSGREATRHSSGTTHRRHPADPASVLLAAASDQPGRAALDAADPCAVARVLDQPEAHRLPMPAPVRAALIPTGMHLRCGCSASSEGHGVRVARGCQGNGKLQTKAGQRSDTPFLLSPDLSETLLRPFRNGRRMARTNPPASEASDEQPAGRPK